MELNGSHRKWPTTGRRCARIENVLIVCTTMCIFSLMMLLKVEMYSGNNVLWNSDFSAEQTVRNPTIRQMAMPAMKTIIAYSPEKQLEMDRRHPVVCDNRIKPPKNIKEGSWQKVSGGVVSLYAGYYDDRIPNYPYLRILAITNGTTVDEIGPLYCQTYHIPFAEDVHDEVHAVEATLTPIWWKEWDPGSKDAITPLLISCALSQPKQDNFLASVTTDPCEEVSNVLSVQPTPAEEFSRNFTVCVKDLQFNHDISERLVEWFELLKLLGADKVDVYVGGVPPSVHNVLKYYNATGMATIHAAPRPVANSLWQRRRDHLLAYNDCLYRNLRSSRYVVPLDIDEVIVPRKNETWTQLLKRLDSIEHKPPGAASLAVSNAFFFDSFSDEDSLFYTENGYFMDEQTKYMLMKRNMRASNRLKPHTLRHVLRSALVSSVPQYSKSFVSTSRALTVFNHYALNGLAGAERARAVPPELALLHHYKATCRPALVECHQYTTRTVKDETILRYSNQLITNIDRVLDSI